MNAPVTITAALDADTVALVDALANAKGMTGAEFAAAAIREAAAREQAFKAFVQAGIDSADRGELIGQDEMEAWFEEQIAAPARA